MRLLRPALASLILVACTMPKAVGEGESTGAPTGGELTATEGMSSATDPSDTDGMSSATDPSGGDTGAEIPHDGLYIDCGIIGSGNPTVGGGDPGPTGFPPYACNPRTSGVGAAGHVCCSVDPSTADGELPAYEGKGISGSTPLYADAANGAGTWGMCVNTTEIPEGFGLLADAAENCPIPCNPTWSDGDVATVCGQGRVCCQTTELQPKDCVFDETTELWRAVNGNDIGSYEVTPQTYWNATAHETHQDPNGTVCLAFSGGDETSPLFEPCVRQLTVADQRGYCMGLEIGQGCPTAAPTYVDVCEAMNG